MTTPKQKRKTRVIWAVVSDNELFIEGLRVSDVYRKRGVLRLQKNERWVKFKEVL
jgi:hypothetical protein